MVTLDQVFTTDFQWITSDHKDDGVIRLYLRNSWDLKLGVDVHGYRPYFYAKIGEQIPITDRIIRLEVDKEYEHMLPESEYEIEYNTNTKKKFKALRGEILKKIVVQEPNDVKDLRENFSRTWESDVKYLLRFLIDRKIKSGVKIVNNKEFDIHFNKNGVLQVHYSQLFATEYITEPVVLGFDIELDNFDGKLPSPKNPKYPIIAITIWENKNNTYFTLFLSGSESQIYRNARQNNWLIKDYADEAELLNDFFTFIRKLQPDLIFAWNLDFDYNNTEARAKKLGVNTYVRGFMKFDLIPFYVKIRGKSFGLKLKEVVVEEGIRKKEDLVADAYDLSLYEDQSRWDEFLSYNLDDVLFMFELIKKYRMIDYFWNLRSFCGVLDFNGLLYNSFVIETILFHLATVILPNVDRSASGTYKGAINFKPIPGVYYGVALLDFSKHFPLTIITGNYSAEYEHLSDEERLQMPPGQAVILAEYLMQFRQKQDDLLDKMLEKYGLAAEEYKAQKPRRDAAKFLLNSDYGYMGYKGSRLKSAKIAEKMVKSAMDVLELVREWTEEYGFKVIYGHTDSIMVLMPFDKTDELIDHLNKKLHDYAISIGAEPRWDIKTEQFGDVIFPPVKSRAYDEGAATKWAMRVYYKDGRKVEPYTIIKGFEAIRKDSPPIARTLQRGLFEAIFNKTVPDFIKSLKKIVKDVKAGKVDIDELAVPVTIGDKIENYKGNPQHIRAAKYSIRNFGLRIGEGDRIKKLPVKYVKGKPATDIVAYFEKKEIPGVVPDFEKIVEKSIKDKLTLLLSILGKSWKDVEGGTSSLSKFL